LLITILDAVIARRLAKIGTRKTTIHACFHHVAEELAIEVDTHAIVFEIVHGQVGVEYPVSVLDAVFAARARGAEFTAAVDAYGAKYRGGFTLVADPIFAGRKTFIAIGTTAVYTDFALVLDLIKAGGVDFVGFISAARNGHTGQKYHCKCF
jgi:hypothetical protein